MEDSAGTDEGTGMAAGDAAVIMQAARERAERELTIRRPLGDQWRRWRAIRMGRS